MPNVPAFCETCGTAFPSGLVADRSSFSVSNFVAGPCPQCGNMGRVPDGLYKIVGNTIEVLANSERSISDLQRIARILKSAKERGLPPQEISSTLKKELPELSSLADTVPKTRAELYALVAIILTIIGMLINARSGKESPRIEIQQVINNVAGETQVNENIVGSKQPVNPKKKMGRNEPCRCGSGKKYKKCCGA